MVRHKVILRPRKTFSLMDFITLSLDGTNTYNIKFCPRATWLNVRMPRAKNTSIDLGIKIYLYAFQTDTSVHLEALVLLLGWMAGGTGLTTHKNRPACAWRADTLKDEKGRVFRAACWIHRLTQGLPGRARNLPTAEETFAEK